MVASKAGKNFKENLLELKEVDQKDPYLTNKVVSNLTELQFVLTLLLILHKLIFVN